MNNARRYPNGIALPEGKVLITGGTKRGNNNGADSVPAVEIWNPASNTWTVGASAAQYRGYHSFSILLPSGVVLSTGGGTPGPVTNLNAEVYYPPSLFRTVGGAAQLAPRPVIVALSGLSYVNGGDLQLDLADASPISGLVLLGTSNGTHSFNSGQRRIPLTFTQESYRLTTSIPGNTIVPPGYYQLVAVDANGVPSRGVIIAVGQGVAPPPVPTTPYDPPDLTVPVAAPIIAANGTASYVLPSTLGVTYSWNFGDGTPDSELLEHGVDHAHLRVTGGVHRDVDGPGQRRLDLAPDAGAGRGHFEDGVVADQLVGAGRRDARRGVGAPVGRQPRQRQRRRRRSGDEQSRGRDRGRQWTAHDRRGAEWRGLGGEPRVGIDQRHQPHHAGGDPHHRSSASIGTVRPGLRARSFGGLRQPAGHQHAVEAGSNLGGDRCHPGSGQHRRAPRLRGGRRDHPGHPLHHAAAAWVSPPRR